MSTEKKLPYDLRETPLGDPRAKTDWTTTKQTDEPLEGRPGGEAGSC